MVGIILKYEHFFRDPIPSDKFELIKHIPRVELIASFSSINHTQILVLR